jgi:Family of unknown function (DUF6188)
MAYGSQRAGNGAVRVTSPASGRWELPVEGFEVLGVEFGFPIDIVTYGDGGVSTRIQFGGSFEFSEPDGEVHRLSASDQSWEELAVVLSLRHDYIKSAIATAAAQLRLEFVSGRCLSAGPDPDYENWQISGPEFNLIALPGNGEVANFGAYFGA